MTDSTTATNSPAPSGLFAFAECEAVNMSNGGVLLINRESGAQFLVAPPVAQSLQMCRVFRTLPGHAAVLVSSIPELAGQQADVMNVLGMVRDAGLMVSAEAACARLNTAVPPAVDRPATRAFIITCDRPAAVERLLETMLRSSNLSRHEAIFLIDDSRDSGNAERNREAVEQFNLTSPRNMRYFGAAEARQLMDDLIAELPQQEEAIRFLVDRERWAGEKTYGLARNLCLLLSVGRRAIVMDDDVLCLAVESPHKEHGVGFGQREREVDFYSNTQEMEARTTRTEFDPLNGHASCLGLTMGQALKQLTGQPLQATDLAGANNAYLSQWSADSPVLITQSGTVGDPGTPGTEWLYTLDARSSKRLLDFNGGVGGALQSRCYWLGQTQPLFSKLAVISQVSGLDNTALLPPYFPVFRGEDYLFGAITEYLHPHSAVLEYAWSVPHIPIEQRQGDPNPAPSDGKGKLNINKYVTDRTVYDEGITPQSRLNSLAALMRQLSETSDKGLEMEFRKEVAEAQSDEYSRLNRLLQDGMIRPPGWQDWLEQSVRQVGDAMQVPAALGDLASIPEGLDVSEIIELFRSNLAGFAGSLGCWQAIRNAATTVSIP
ncbi:hypothetical protein [Haliea sp. E17]|uniref:hypothetical protein n=1 Tax=Haliea sp. E17 TaxID=3401576 RepID=UPI003AB081F0